MLVKKVMTDGTGSIVISVLLGLGLAALFRKACNGNSCVVIKAPNLTEVSKYTYKLDTDCFKYRPQVVPCPLAKGGVTAVSDEIAARA